MKQNITTKQLNELSETGVKNYEQWLKKAYNAVPAIGADGKTMLGLLLSIGQMIEFLMDAYEPDDGYDVICKSWGNLSLGYFEGEYCDELWGMVKQVLEKKP